MTKILRLTTADISLNSLLKGQLRFLSKEFEIVGVASDTGVLQTVSDREGIRVVNMPMHREISLLNDLKSLIALIRLFRQERPDIVHANTPKASLLGMIAAMICCIPHRLYTVTGLRFETSTGMMRLILKTMERITCICATKVIPEGDGVKNVLIREKITRKPMTKIHNGNINGVDLEWYDRTEDVMHQIMQIRGGITEFRFIFVGRIVKDKGICELIDAFARLCDTRNDVKLILVGCFEDNLDPLPEATKMIISNNNQIDFVGYQSDVRPYLASSDVLVLPSYREGFPNVLLQAGAMGLPVIVTDVNGSDEVIEQGINGIIIPKYDTEAAYNAMTAMVDNREYTAQMANVTRKMVADKFDQRDVWAAISEMYKSLE